MEYGKVTSSVVDDLKKICGEQYVFTSTEQLGNFSHDYTEDLRFMPEVAVKPSTASEISEILKLCNRLLIPVTPRGGGTGLSGGALPVFGGVVISMERFNRI